MTKFIFGGQEVEVPVLNLAAIRVASRLLPSIMPKKGDDVSSEAYKLAQTDKTFDVFLQVLACQLEDEDDAAKSVWTYRKIERSIKGAEEMGKVLTGMWDLLQDSGFIKKGEPLPAGLAQVTETGSPTPEPETQTA